MHRLPVLRGGVSVRRHVVQPIDRKVFKCDLCDGDPQCVRFCDTKAVNLVDAGDVSLQKGREAAKRLRAAESKSSSLVA